MDHFERASGGVLELVRSVQRFGGGRHDQRGEHERVDLEDGIFAIQAPSEDMLALDEALTELDATDKVKADLVRLRYFAGLTMEQAAELLGLSLSTAKRHWRYAKAWLYTHMTTGS